MFYDITQAFALLQLSKNSLLCLFSNVTVENTEEIKHRSERNLLILSLKFGYMNTLAEFDFFCAHQEALVTNRHKRVSILQASVTAQL